NRNAVVLASPTLSETSFNDIGERVEASDSNTAVRWSTDCSSLLTRPGLTIMQNLRSSARYRHRWAQTSDARRNGEWVLLVPKVLPPSLPSVSPRDRLVEHQFRLAEAITLASRQSSVGSHGG